MKASKRVTRRSKEPKRIEVEVNAESEPLSIGMDGERHNILAVYERWRLEDEWWGKEERRCYYKIQTGHGLVCDIYHEMLTDIWYLARTYD